MGQDLSQSEFIEMLIEAGWDQEEATEEWNRQMGPEGDIDGDLEG
jgi:hypothetical protein